MLLTFHRPEKKLRRNISFNCVASSLTRKYNSNDICQMTKSLIYLNHSYIKITHYLDTSSFLPLLYRLVFEYSKCLWRSQNTWGIQTHDNFMGGWKGRWASLHNGSAMRNSDSWIRNNKYKPLESKKFFGRIWETKSKGNMVRGP